MLLWALSTPSLPPSSPVSAPPSPDMARVKRLTALKGLPLLTQVKHGPHMNICL